MIISFTCMPRRLALEPGDLISITSDGTEYICRIISSLLTPSYTNEIVCESLLANVSFDYTVDYLPRHGNPPGTSNPTQFLDELIGNDNGGEADGAVEFVGGLS